MTILVMDVANSLWIEVQREGMDLPYIPYPTFNHFDKDDYYEDVDWYIETILMLRADIQARIDKYRKD